jgi:hypothetical protein
MPKKRTEDKILESLLLHKTIREAAVAAKVTERTIYDYLTKPEFEKRYQDARADIIRGVTNLLRENLTRAAGVIVKIMEDENLPPATRLTAAKTLLEYGKRYTEMSDIQERIRKIEESILQTEQ